jgi:hypothetical protein
VIGTGWTSILVATLPADAAGLTDPAVPSDGAAPSDAAAPGDAAAPSVAPLPSDAAAPGEAPTARDGAESGAAPAAQLQSILGSLPPVSGDWGSGRLLESTLFSVLITDDGRVLGGAVAPEALYEAAAQ